MKVILLDNVRTVGKVGDIKVVRDGYARNFLFPRSLAKPATPGFVKDVEGLKSRKLASYGMALRQAQATAAKLADTVIEIHATANEQGTLFAQVEPEQIASELSRIAGVTIDPAAIRTDRPLKTLGEHMIPVVLTDDVTAMVRVKIVS